MRSAWLPRSALATLVGVAAAAAVVLAAAADPVARGGGTWTTLAPSPFKRSEVAAARVGDRIYVVGGFVASGRTVSRVAAYDISEDDWQVRRPLPQAVNHPGAAALRGKLYVLGGNRAAGEPRSRALWRYHPKANRWRRLPAAPTARAAMGMTAANRKLYAVGGAEDGNSALRRLEVYHVGKRRWRTRAPMPTGRNHLTAVWALGSLWAIGGRDDSGNFGTVERWRPAENAWQSMPDLNVPRGGVAAAVAADSIIVFGGEELQPGGTTIAEVERLPFDDLDGPWQLLDSMPTPRHGLGGAARGDFVYALEGGPQPRLTTSRVLERLDLSGLAP
jgi:Kelch motif